MKSTLTQARVKELLDYDPETGIFRYKVYRKGMNGRVGDIATYPKENGYLFLSIDWKECRAHRIAWLYVYGTLPPQLDHRDRDRTNNRIRNLRIATHFQNQMNVGLSSRNSSGFKGVSRAKFDKWQAHIRYDGKAKYLGTFETADLASEFYNLAAQMIQGEFYAAPPTSR